jgi:hypothetical protein
MSVWLPAIDVFLSMVSSDTTRVKKAAVVERRSRESARIPMFFPESEHQPSAGDFP